MNRTPRRESTGRRLVLGALLALVIGTGSGFPVQRAAQAAPHGGTLAVNITGPMSSAVNSPATYTATVTNNPSGGNCSNYSYTWNFNDPNSGTNNIASGQSATHSFVGPGTDTIFVYVNDGSCGDSGTGSLTVSVGSSSTGVGCPSSLASTLGVTANPSSPSVNTSVNFTVNATGSTILWQFGDNSTGSGQTVGHAYGTAGTYYPYVTVQNGSSVTCGSTVIVVGGGNVSNSSSGISVGINQPINGTAGQPVSISGFAQSYNTGATITSYSWSFGDGQSGTGASVQHSYSNGGNYTVTLTATDSTGHSNATTAQASISGGSGSGSTNSSVTANGVTANPGGPYSGTAGTAISFNGSGSSNNNGASVSSYSWSFGDGASGSGVSTSHSYSTNGTFTVALTVTDSGGHVATGTTTATIGGGSSGGSRVVNLVAGCNNVSVTFPDNTPTTNVLNAISLQSALQSIWRLDSVTGRFLGFFPGATQATDLPTVNRLDAVFICVNAAVSFSEPAV